MSKTVEANLNGLQLSIDSKTGGIVKMSYPGPGTMIDASPGETGMIDLAYPIKQFEPLRLASRFSSDAKIDVTDDSLTVSWSKLGASRTNFPLDGDVSATVRFKAEPDGRSIIMTCEVDNKSKIAVRQVIFPDFYGLVPFGDEDNTIFKSCGFGRTPFRELHPTEGRKSTQFCMDVAAYSGEYTSGGRFSSMVNRWMDLSGFNGGFSVFPRSWGWDPRYTVRLHHSEVEEKLRMLCVHPVEVKPGEKWQSPEFVLTPHQSGWAKGIEPYREWVKQHMKREYPVPKHIREGLGYRTIWMSKFWPEDPQDAVWKAKDLPAIARENVEYGLPEMVIWGSHNFFELPIPPIYPHLGTQAEFAEAIKECKKIGVNAAPFISIVLAGPKTAEKYGLVANPGGGWTQHTETIPRFNPPYSASYAAAQAGPTNPLWQKEALESCKSLIDSGIPSISWDQFWNMAPDINMIELTSKIRAMAKAKDPDSTLSGEELWNMELDANQLDYLWNWGGYGDSQAFTNAFPAPRINACVSDDPWTVKRGFSDNLFLNVFPRKAGSVNGSDWIKNWPELGKALKQCAKLRKQFLPYFTDGVLIGNCILTEPCSAAHVSSYVMPDRVMVLVTNEAANERTVTFKYNLLPWLKAPSSKYEMRVYDIDGKLLDTKEISSRVKTQTTNKLANLDIAIYEFIAK
ncbi:MAG: DUF6259 domain-containing protein [Armatimonadota bacterium]